MKTKRIFMTGAAGLALLALTFSGCRKKAEEDKDTQAAADYEQAELISSDVVNMTEIAESGVSSFKTASEDDYANTLSTCATVTFDTANSADPDTLTIDFGPTNCQGSDGRYRRGVITIIRTGNRFTAGSYRIVTFNNYYVNDHHIEGEHKVTANGKNNSGNWNWTIEAKNMKVTNPQGKWHTWNSTRNREWIAGSGTLVRSDDVFLITGNADGTNIKGVTYTAVITNSLRKEIGCKWLVSGTVVITPSNKPQRILDFGNGACDNQATVTINGNTYNITLK